MLPIAVLPVAGLLLRLGQPDLLQHRVRGRRRAMPIFHNLGLLFAIGVAVGFAGTATARRAWPAWSASWSPATAPQALMTVPPDMLAGFTGKAADLATAASKAGAIAELSVPLGILSGVIAGAFYNRFGAIKLPEYLAFFGGRRFVPIVSGLAGLALAAVVRPGLDGDQRRHRRPQPRHRRAPVRSASSSTAC